MTLRSTHTRLAAHLLGKVTRLPRKLRRDESGVAAVEFALIAPVLVFLYIGLYQISFLIQQDRNVSHATSVMGDLTTRFGNMNDEDVADVMQAAVEVLRISNTNTLSDDVMMDVSSYMEDAAGVVTRIGYASTNNSTLPEFDPATLNDRMLSPEIGTVVTRIKYTYRMTSNSQDIEDANSKKYLGGDGIVLAEQFIMRPRVSSNIRFGPADTTLPTEEYTCSIDANRVVSC